MSKVRIDFLVDDEPFITKKLDPKQLLSEIRTNLKIGEELNFLANNKCEILKDDESDYSIEECLIDKNKIMLKKVKKTSNLILQSKKVNL